MIEPLSAFYILEGLLFDAIGAIFIVSGILNRGTKLDFFISELRDEIKELRSESWGLMNIQKSIMDARKNNEPQFVIDNLNYELQEFEEKSLDVKITWYEVLSIQIHNILIGFLAESKTDQSRVRIGLPFLLGGFTLQGIGVITQLYF